MTSRINWVVQSSGVDYLHLLIVLDGSSYTNLRHSKRVPHFRLTPRGTRETAAIFWVRGAGDFFGNRGFLFF